MLLAAITNLSAQPTMESTGLPNIYIDEVDATTHIITFENTDEDPSTVIYFRINEVNYSFIMEEWLEYTDPILFEQEGEFRVEAYAQAPDKQPSDLAVTYFRAYYNEPSFIEYVYDFYVDGIYYKRSSSGEAIVTTEGLEWNIEYPAPLPISQCYSGDVVIPETVEYEGITYTVTGIDNEAFMGCDVTSLELPSTINRILSMVVYESHTLEKVVCKAIMPPTASFDSFTYSEVDPVLFVPNESLEVYRNTEVWCDFRHIVPFIGAGPGDIDGDGEIAVTDVTGLISMLLNGDELPAYCDVDGDEEIDINDITQLISILLN